jgi:glycerate kinase
VTEGWRRSAPYDVVDPLPLSDGGPGFLDVLHEHLGGQVAVVTVPGPVGPPVPARVLVAGHTAYVEAAEAAGLHLLDHGGPGATRPSSHGVGELVAAALDTGAGRVVVGVGGTGTADGGQGMVAALGGLDAARARVAGVELVAATATDAPLMGPSGAAHGFGAGKGLGREAREALERELREWATATDGGLAVRAGAGAGGGIGFGLLLLGAERCNGTELVTAAAGLDDRVRAADLALTGQGVLDREALRGRVIVAVARAAQRAGRPTVVLARRVEVGRRELSATGVDAAFAVEAMPGSDPGHPAAEALVALAARVARTWSH